MIDKYKSIIRLIMNKREFTKAITGLTFFGLGIVLLSTLINLLDGSNIYSWILPILFILGGLSLLTQHDPNNKRNIGISLLTVGAVTLLVQMEVLKGDIVSAVLGVVLLSAGVAILTELKSKKYHNNDEEI